MSDASDEKPTPDGIGRRTFLQRAGRAAAAVAAGVGDLATPFGVRATVTGGAGGAVVAAAAAKIANIDNELTEEELLRRAIELVQAQVDAEEIAKGDVRGIYDAVTAANDSLRSNELRRISGNNARRMLNGAAVGAGATAVILAGVAAHDHMDERQAAEENAANQVRIQKIQAMRMAASEFAETGGVDFRMKDWFRQVAQAPTIGRLRDILKPLDKNAPVGKCPEETRLASDPNGFLSTHQDAVDAIAVLAGSPEYVSMELPRIQAHSPVRR